MSDVLALDGPLALVDVIVPMLSRPAGEIDRQLGGAPCEHLLDAVRELNRGRAEGRRDAFYAQQLLLSKIYELGMSLRDTPSAEGSVVLYRVTRLLEDATIAAEDAGVDQDLLSAAPEAEYVSWIKTIARAHRAFKHPYYTEFIRDQAGKLDLRNYVIQESVVDARFDDLLAMTQIGTDGAAKMEIARNFWDEMGNGDPAEVHTRLFNQIFDVLAITPEELAAGLSARRRFEVEHMTYPYGVHVVLVDVDRGTGLVQVLRYLVAYEIGRAINPTMVEGQLLGGVAQGVGGALLEEFRYDEAGQPQAVTFMDYLVPTAAELPRVDVLVRAGLPQAIHRPEAVPDVLHLLKPLPHHPGPECLNHLVQHGNRRTVGDKTAVHTGASAHPQPVDRHRRVPGRGRRPHVGIPRAA
ncbi:molybdopterin cofactor-binding domain-containing protein, partial [Kibdelosporangium lantanae]